jgi:hypothetical protein
MAGGTISAVVMAYTEGAQSPFQRLHTDSSASSLSEVQFLDQGRALQVDQDGNNGKNKNVHTNVQQSNLANSLDFDDYILDDGYELLPHGTRHQRQTIEGLPPGPGIRRCFDYTS